MLDMAKRRSKPAEQTQRVRTGENVNVWINAELFAAFETLRKQTRRSKTAEIEMILEEALAKHGLWPPTRKRD